MHLEVGWTIASESEDHLHFVTAQSFGKSGIRNHICEVRKLQSPNPNKTQYHCDSFVIDNKYFETTSPKPNKPQYLCD